MLFLNNYASRVSHVRAKNFLTHCEKRDASWATESNIDGSVEESLVAIKEGIIESNADLVSVKLLFFLVLLELFLILLKHVPDLAFQIPRQILF
jgi:hypothetical protein